MKTELKELINVGKTNNKLIVRTNRILTITNIVNIITIVLIVWVLLK